jgi:hypothetical protein
VREEKPTWNVNGFNQFAPMTGNEDDAPLRRYRVYKRQVNKPPLSISV